MNSKSRYELAASVCRGKVWLDNTALPAISRMYRKRIENATSKLEATVEQGRYASFRIDQALDHPKASRLVLQQMIASLEEVIGQLFIFEAGSRINTNRYTCLISQFREKQALAKRALEHSDKNNTRKCLFSKLFIIFVGSLRGLTYFDESVSLLSCAENLVNLK